MEDIRLPEFEYIDLNDIDPTPELLPEGVYTLMVVKANARSGVSQKTGNPYSCISFTFAVTDHEQYSGRRIFETVFLHPNGLKALRRLMDATGVAQQPGQPLSEWIRELAAERATFKAHVRQIEERDGDVVRTDPETGRPATRNAISWFRLMPA